MSFSFIDKIFLERPAFIITVFFVWVGVVLYFSYPFVAAHKFVTLHKIFKTGELTMITQNSPHCYYIYRDEPMGFEYELTKSYADHLGVRLKIKLVDKWENMIPELLEGSGALIAAGIPKIPEQVETVEFSQGYMQIRPHIITHRHNVNINTPADLTGKTVHVKKNSPHHRSLLKLQDHGIDLIVQPHDDISVEELIQKVSEREIEVTIAYDYIAILHRRHYPGIVMKDPIGEAQQLGWAVNPKAQELLASINSFFRTLKSNHTLAEIYKKYYGDTGDLDYVDLRVFHRRIKSRLSRFSPFIKHAARMHGFDWRLIAAQIYQESHLNPWAKSAAGAKGLMQLMPRTARSLGVKDIYNPVENINAGVQHLKNLFDQFAVSSNDDRLLISLAAYNIGSGHIRDARDIAVKMNLDPNQWSSLKKTLPLLGDKKYYQDSRFGYCRGEEPIRYIEQIMTYYDILKRQGIQYGTSQLES